MRIQDSAKGKFVIVVGPSGTGKNTMAGMLREKCPEVIFSVSATTRAMRDGEIEGENYYYLSKEVFKEKIENDEFFEWAMYADNYYGTLKEPIFDAINSGKIIISDIECDGFLQVKKLLPEKNFVSIFFMPPELDVLIGRIRSRAKISDEELEKRLKILESEMKYVDEATVKFYSVDGDIDGSFKVFENIVDEFVFEK